MTDTVAIVPAYNEAATVGSVVEGATPHVDAVVVVDDGSADDTVAVAREAGASVIEHQENRGVGAALRTGYRHAARDGYQRVVQLDADGQHDPADLPALCARSSPGRLVIATRYRTASIREYSWTRRAGIRAFSSVVNLVAGIDTTDVTSGYRVFYTADLPAVSHDSDGHWAVEQTLGAALAGLDIVEVPVSMAPRAAGESQFSAGTLALYPARMAETVARVLIQGTPDRQEYAPDGGRECIELAEQVDEAGD